jgi:hypothetical protein
VSSLADPGEEIPGSQRAAADSIIHQVRAAPTAATPPTIQLLGTDIASKQIVAGLVSNMLGLRPYRLDWNLLPASPVELDALARLWQRECLLLPVALFLDADSAEGGQAGGSIG